MTNTNKSKFNWVLAVFITASCVATLFSCKKENAEPYEDKGSVHFIGKANSLQMAPLLPVGSPGTATLTARYDNNAHIFNYFLKWQNMSAGVTRADMYFQNNAVANGLFARTLFTSATPRPAILDSISGAIYGTFEFSASELADLKAGKIYYTVTTQSNLSGEIRGQILVK